MLKFWSFYRAQRRERCAEKCDLWASRFLFFDRKKRVIFIFTVWKLHVFVFKKSFFLIDVNFCLSRRHENVFQNNHKCLLRLVYARLCWKCWCELWIVLGCAQNGSWASLRPRGFDDSQKDADLDDLKTVLSKQFVLIWTKAFNKIT